MICSWLNWQKLTCSLGDPKTFLATVHVYVPSVISIKTTRCVQSFNTMLNPASTSCIRRVVLYQQSYYKYVKKMCIIESLLSMAQTVSKKSINVDLLLACPNMLSFTTSYYLSQSWWQVHVVMHSVQYIHLCDLNDVWCVYRHRTMSSCTNFHTKLAVTTSVNQHRPSFHE